MQKALFTHEDLEKAVNKLCKIPTFSHFTIKTQYSRTLHKLKYQQIMGWPKNNYPCIADEMVEEEIECICWEVHREKVDEA